MSGNRAAEGAVFSAASATAALDSIPNALVALAIGLLGVALARWVFVNREARRLSRRESWRETLPLTLVAMLVAAVVIHDRQLGFSGSAFVGLGVGWAAVLLLDILGERVMAALRGALGAASASPRFPPSADHSGEDGRVRSADVDLPPDIAALADEAARRLDDQEERDGGR